MKTFKLFFIALSIMLFGACEKSADNSLSNEDMLEFQEDDGNQSLKSRDQRTMPFKADFYTIRTYDYDGEVTCTEGLYVSLNYQVGAGNGTHLGKFTTELVFCGDDATFTYKNGEGAFVAANGDSLFYFAPSPDSIGAVIPYVHPLYELQFQDPFSFNGGTGRFEGATGSGYTNSFVDIFDDEGNFIPEHRTDHVWTGKLILPKKNR